MERGKMPQPNPKLAQLVSQVRVRMVRDVAGLRVGGRELSDLRQGSQVSVPVWAAEAMRDEGLAEPIGGAIDLQKLTQLTWRERRSLVELVELPDKFYYNMLLALSSLRERESEAYRALLEAFRDIVSIRMSKLLGYASRGVDPSLIKNMVEEERELYLRVRAVIEEWLELIGLKVR